MHLPWGSVINVLGLSSLIAVVLNWWLASRREHRGWVLDNKKLEWRELIDELHSCFGQMVYAFQAVNVIASDGCNDPHAGMQKGRRLIRNRIFIAEALRLHSILQKWEELVAYCNSVGSPREPGQQGGPTAAAFDRKAAAFEDELLQLAREDLQADSWRSQFAGAVRGLIIRTRSGGDFSR
jgi:hypothetical protein